MSEWGSDGLIVTSFNYVRIGVGWFVIVYIEACGKTLLPVEMLTKSSLDKILERGGAFVLLCSPSVYSHSFSSDPTTVNKTGPNSVGPLRLAPFTSWLFLLTLSRESDLHSIYLSCFPFLFFFFFIFALKRQPAFVIILGQWNNFITAFRGLFSRCFIISIIQPKRLSRFPNSQSSGATNKSLLLFPWFSLFSLIYLCSFQIFPRNFI